jgi:hypothetical protein
MQPCRDRERRLPPRRSAQHHDLTWGRTTSTEWNVAQILARPFPDGEIREDRTVPSATTFGPFGRGTRLHDDHGIHERRWLTDIIPGAGPTVRPSN